MACGNCDPRPGKLISIGNPDDPHCNESIFRKSDWSEEITKRWDKYFLTICNAVASKSPCLSRKIGAILVRDNSIVSTGYNGPPRGVPHCGHDRYMKDETIDAMAPVVSTTLNPIRFHSECPRKVMGFASGTHMELCPAQHAEQNAISNAARMGVSVFKTTLYINYVIPCKSCFGALINAGIIEIVVENKKLYDENSKFIIENSNIKIREFKI